jgi:hypothetical protein
LVEKARGGEALVAVVAALASVLVGTGIVE